MKTKNDTISAALRSNAARCYSERRKLANLDTPANIAFRSQRCASDAGRAVTAHLFPASNEVRG